MLLIKCSKCKEMVGEDHITTCNDSQYCQNCVEPVLYEQGWWIHRLRKALNGDYKIKERG